MTVTPIALRTVAAMFSIKGSAGAELKNFKALAAADAVKCKQIYADGEKLIVLAGNGEYAQFKRYASTLDNTSIMGYFSAKALMASLIGGHLMLSTFILENGYPLNMTVGLPNIVHDCLRELSDFECVPIVRLFVSKGFDVNRQEKDTWIAPLHVAITRELVDTMKELLEAGADVNIVASNDVMPLTLAQGLPADSPAKAEIVAELLKRGARMTWRRDNSGSSLASGGTTFDTSFNTNTQIKAAGGKSDTFASYPASSAPQQKVRFNGASMVLESVPVPAPTVRGTATGASGDALPPAPPKVSVSTASGARLLPPPRVVATERIDAEVGEGVQADDVATDAQAEQKSSADQEAREDLQGLLRALQSARLEESGNTARAAEEAPAEATVGSFQMSDDGAAMLFSTG